VRAVRAGLGLAPPQAAWRAAAVARGSGPGQDRPPWATRGAVDSRGAGPRGATGIARGAAWAAETGGGPGALSFGYRPTGVSPAGTLVTASHDDRDPSPTGPSRIAVRGSGAATGAGTAAPSPVGGSGGLSTGLDGPPPAPVPTLVAIAQGSRFSLGSLLTIHVSLLLTGAQRGLLTGA